MSLLSPLFRRYDTDICSTAVKSGKELGLCKPGDTLCLDVGDRPLLSNVRKGLIDPDTPKWAHHRKDENGKELKLVVSSFNNVRSAYQTNEKVLRRIQQRRPDVL